MNKNKLIPELRFPEFLNEGEWQKKILEDVLDYERPDNYIVSETDYKNEGTPVLTANKSFILGYTQEKFGIYNNLPAVIFDDFTVDSKFVDFPFKVKSSAIKILTPKKKDNLKFIYELISQVSFEAKEHKRYYISEYQKLELLFPLPNEQQKIASCLSSLDEVIAAHSQKLELLKDHKKGLMQNLFPQEGESSPKYRFTEFNVPLNKVGFADLGEIKIGLTHKPDYISSGVPFLSSKNISNGFIDFKNVQYISQEKFDSMPESTKPRLGDILFTRVGSNLGNPIVLEQEIEFGIFVSLGAFRVNKKAHNYYIKYWMESDLFWKQLNQKVAGGAKDNLNSTWLKEFELFIPSIEEQQKIASCLSSLDALITAQTEKIEQLKLHKKGLMQGLFPKINTD